jgi:sec-independent protein translocase protein TatB
MGTPPIEMANLGMADSLILMVMALVVFGPRRLPQIGRQIGKLMYEFRKASNDFKFQMEEELRTSEEADRRKKEEERQRALALAAPAPEAVLAAPAPEVVIVKPVSPDAEPVSVEPIPASSASDSAAGTAIAQETYPRIMPPSTGETIARAHPASAALELENSEARGPDQSTAISGQPGPSTAPEASAAEAMMSEGAPTVPGGPETEQGAHHG